MGRVFGRRRMQPQLRRDDLRRDRRVFRHGRVGSFHVSEGSDGRARLAASLGICWAYFAQEHNAANRISSHRPRIELTPALIARAHDLNAPNCALMGKKSPLIAHVSKTSAKSDAGMKHLLQVPDRCIFPLRDCSCLWEHLSDQWNNSVLNGLN